MILVNIDFSACISQIQVVQYGTILVEKEVKVHGEKHSFSIII